MKRPRSPSPSPICPSAKSFKFGDSFSRGMYFAPARPFGPYRVRFHFILFYSRPWLSTLESSKAHLPLFLLRTGPCSWLLLCRRPCPSHPAASSWTAALHAILIRRRRGAEQVGDTRAAGRIWRSKTESILMEENSRVVVEMGRVRGKAG